METQHDSPTAPARTPTWRRRFAVLGGIAAGLLVVRLAFFGEDPVPVRLALAERGPVESTITNSKAGTIKARRRSRVAAETGGRVIEVAFREGERVESGAIVVRLDTASFDAQLSLAQEASRVAQANQRQACLTRDQARRDVERYRKLGLENIVAPELLEKAETQFSTAEAACSAALAEIDRSRAAEEAARAELVKTEIRAPFSGIVAEVNTEVGEWVTPSPPLLTSPPVIDLIDPTSLYVSAPMDEVDSGRVRIGQTAKITVDSHPGREWSGKVVRVAPYVSDVEAQNRTVDIDVEFDDDEFAATLLPGTSADIEVLLERKEDVLRIPTSSLIEGGKLLVFDDGRLVERKVETGLRNWNFVEITQGLAAGERIVLSLDRVEVKAGARAEAQETDEAPDSAR